METLTLVLEKDEAYQNYLIEKSIKMSLDQIHINILNREKKYSDIKRYLVFNSLMALGTILSCLIPGGGAAVAIAV